MFLSLTLFISFSVNASNEGTALRRSNGLLHFVAEQDGFSDVAIQKVIGNRCSRYMPISGRAPCKGAVKKLIATLDYDVIFSADNAPGGPRETWAPSSYAFIAFKKNLIQLLSTPKTTQYLNDLNQQLYKYLAEGLARPNIWEVTKGYYVSDEMTALVMATLYQDTSTMKLHLAYLERAGTNGNVQFHNNKELLSRVIDTINLILDSSEDIYRSLFYPPEIQKDLNRNIYHFYVPLYLAMTLEIDQGVPQEYAYAASLMLNLTYEFITSSNDYEYLFKDPEVITSESDLKDIFGGYCGANIGVRGMQFNKDYENVRSTFSRSTAEGVKLLLKH